MTVIDVVCDYCMIDPPVVRQIIGTDAGPLELDVCVGCAIELEAGEVLAAELRLIA